MKVWEYGRNVVQNTATFGAVSFTSLGGHSRISSSCMNGLWSRILPAPLQGWLGRHAYARRAAINAAWVFLERSVRYAIGFFVGIWIARYLGVEQFGLLAYASALVGVIVWLTTLGLDPIAVRELVHDPSRRDDVLGSLLALRALGAGALMLTLLVVLPMVDPTDPRARTLALLIALGQLPMSLDSLDCWFQAQQATARSAIAKLFALAFAVALRILLIWGQAPIEAFAAAILAEGLLVGLALLLAYRRAGGHARSLRPRWHTLRRIVAAGWPLIASTAAVSIYQRVDQVMIGELAGYAAVGAYSVATRFVEALGLVPTILLATVYPALLIARLEDPALYKQRLQALFDVGLWSALVLAVLLWLAAPTLVRILLGPGFEQAGALLNTMAWLPVLMFTGLVRMRVLMAEQALRTALALELLACALNVVGNLLLIPRFGAIGAVWASLGAAAIAPLVASVFSAEVRRCNAALAAAMTAPWHWWQALQPLRR